MNTPFSRRLLLASLVAAAVGSTVLSAPAMAIDDNSTAAVNVDKKGVALRGYDPVSYFTANAPMMGVAKFSASHDGATYHFSSSANRDMFKANPAKYAPQFGGFCAMGVALERKLDGDPQVWTVQDGKLYLNVEKGVQVKYMEDIKGNNTKAEANWPKLENKTPKSLS